MDAVTAAPEPAPVVMQPGDLGLLDQSPEHKPEHKHARLEAAAALALGFMLDGAEAFLDVV